MTDNIEFLKEISSVNYDAMLDNPVRSCKYCSYCENSDIKFKNEYWFKIFCYQFARNLETIHDVISIRTDLQENRCNSLIYWMHNKAKNVYEEAKIQNETKIIDELRKVWNNINETEYKSRSNICKTNYNTITLDNRKRMKKMSDYCENYNDLHGKLTKVRPNCKIFYDYFMKTLDAHGDIVQECRNTHENGICPKQCRYMNYNPENILKNLKCEEVQRPKILEGYIKKEDCENQKKELVPKTDCQTYATCTPEFSFSDYRSVILILLALWGMLPLGSWIKNKFLKKERIQINFDEENEDESSGNYFENLNSNFRNTEYNVPYNSN
ncbi:PIR Superfamily Protein [Plasmodium ovale wallikeri]|uniref:PIR Superfamily Protein n=1 Tax=Plasmodium ovale wallikeri TaxID=864142 RepID=A0A1A9AA74_PLAOA|nr:PIR Superfamily Protein [Plasmodium ovale wallikeri]SBT59299.1 PIR Superfamily Protein [Plasmodium ovale wallikeri]